MSHAPRRRLPDVAEKRWPCCSSATQTDEYVAISATTFFNMSDGEEDLDGHAAPVIEYVEPAPVMTDIT